MKREWTLTHDAFDKLLAQFDDDVERAAEGYELTRSRLIKFFECRSCNLSRELADEVMNRVARRVDEGEEIARQSLSNYFYSVARYVLQEHRRGPERRASSLETLTPAEHPSENPAVIEEDMLARRRRERRLECLESCFEKLPRETRDMIVSYYEEEEGARVAGRKLLAENLGISLSNLRMRAHRIRERLDKCVSDCLDPDAGG